MQANIKATPKAVMAEIRFSIKFSKKYSCERRYDALEFNSTAADTTISMRIRECNKELTARRHGVIALALILFVAAISVRVAETANAFKPARAEDGRPDLQGIWTNSSVTALERPANIQKLVLTPEEAARWVA